METKIQKWGNSNGIRIPNSIIKSQNLKPDDILEIIEDEDKIILKKKTNPFILSERIAQYKGKNLSKEFEWDEPQGKEIW